MAEHESLSGLRREDLAEGDIISGRRLVTFVGGTWAETLVRYTKEGKSNIVNTYYFYEGGRRFKPRGNVIVSEEGVSYGRLNKQLAEAGL